MVVGKGLFSTNTNIRKNPDFTNKYKGFGIKMIT